MKDDVRGAGLSFGRWGVASALAAVLAWVGGAQGSEGAAEAPAAPVLNSGDTAWMLVSTALVLLMTVPGLALFYGGLVRSKNVLSTLMHCFFCAAAVSVLWVVVGYTLAFGPGGNLWIGGFDWVGLEGVANTAHPNASTIPHYLFCAYQLTFAVITPALIAGAIAERMRFTAFAAFVCLWSLLIYAPLAHWVWGGGWIATKLGALDFAGGTVVHISSGVAALVAAVYLGKRQGHGVEPMPPHNLPFTVIGAGLLWVGWFGFNAGSAVASGELASLAMINTHVAAAAAAIGWMLAELFRSRRPTILGIASGAVAGLVVITPAAGFVTPTSALVMGMIGGALCYGAVSLKPRIGYDDALDVVGVHFVGGTLGAILTGVLASPAANPDIPKLTAGGDLAAPTSLSGAVTGGLLSGAGPGLLVSQLLAVGATIVFAGAGTWVLLRLIDMFIPVRASAAQEVLGLDLSLHAERGYVIGGGEAVAAAAVGMAEPRSASEPPRAPTRFTVVLDGVEGAKVEERWRGVCRQVTMDGGGGAGTAVPPGLMTVYPNLVTVRGNAFRFRSAEGTTPEEVRDALAAMFADMNPRARLER